MLLTYPACEASQSRSRPSCHGEPGEMTGVLLMLSESSWEEVMEWLLAVL